MKKTCKSLFNTHVIFIIFKICLILFRINKGSAITEISCSLEYKSYEEYKFYFFIQNNCQILYYFSIFLKQNVTWCCCWCLSLCLLRLLKNSLDCSKLETLGNISWAFQYKPEIGDEKLPLGKEMFLNQCFASLWDNKKIRVLCFLNNFNGLWLKWSFIESNIW